MGELAAIYVLRDPRDGAVRYIGMTAAVNHRQGAHARLSAHSRALAAWKAELAAEGLAPAFAVLETVPGEQARQTEREYIDFARSEGHDLLNGGRRPKAATRTVRITVDLPADDHSALRVLAAQEGVDGQRVMRACLAALRAGGAAADEILAILRRR